MDQAHTLLKRYYGYDQFRPGQEEIIRALCGGQDVLAVMPTGAGKSVCFQIPALMQEGISLIVSPLVSLMRDQVMALVQMGVPAAFLNSSLTPRQYALALERARQGRYKLIYVAPERLTSPAFLDFALSARIDLLAVDEAHCISQWGQDFRPAYLEIPRFVASLPRRPVVGAFTATATPQVRKDIETLLALETPRKLVTGFDRENLYLEVRRPGSKKAELLQVLGQQGEDCGIIYCATRKTVEEVHGFLQDNGIRAVRYHAGLPDEERQQSQEDFLFDRCRIMVATNAFGMGIDKSNVRFVIHYNMPKDLESYYQEAGRAGRDGAAARCILLYSGQDVRTQQFLIEKSSENEALDPETARQLRVAEEDRLRRMTFYCHSKRCLRGELLRYFGEKGPENCGNCSVCLGLYQQESPARAPAAPAPGLARPKPNRKALAQAQLTDSQRELFERLRALRASLARRQGVPAFVIFTDKTLLELAVEAPRSPRQLGEISGVGEHKAAAYGEEFLAEIRSFLRQEGEL